MSLDATVSGANANSYLTRSEANDLITSERLYATTWTATTGADQDKALIWATRMVDNAFAWHGAVRHLDQALGWPRAGMLDKEGRYVDADSIPKKVKLAVCDVALELLKRDRLATPELLGQGFRSAAVGSLKVDVDPGMILSMLPSYIILDLQQFGDLDGGAFGGGRAVKLLRT